jgi:hypothetical protein
MINKYPCPRCGGNLLFSHEDGEGEWRCLQCGRPRVQRAPVTISRPVLTVAESVCAECGTPLSGVMSAKRRYCSDRCRMRAARRRWAGRESEKIAG